MDNELKKSLESRQESLITLLKEKRQDLDAERQHQIYGAVREIDYILGMLDVSDESDDEEDEEDEETTDFTTLNDYTEEEDGNSLSSDSDVELVKVEEKRRFFRMPFRIRFKSDEP